MRRAAEFGLLLAIAAGLVLSPVASTRLAPALGRDIRDYRWQPSSTSLTLHAYNDRSEDAEVAGTVPQRTIMQCLGTTTLTRACHFENVYYNISGGRFVYFGPEGATPELFGQGLAGEPWLRLVRCALGLHHLRASVPLTSRHFLRSSFTHAVFATRVGSCELSGLRFLLCVTACATEKVKSRSGGRSTASLTDWLSNTNAACYRYG